MTNIRPHLARSQAKTILLALLPVGLTLLAFGLRVYHLTYQSLWRDEVDALLFATRPLSELLATFRRPGENGPLFFLMLRPWIAAAGQSEFALRFPSALAGALAVPLAYVLTRRLAGRGPALATAALMALAPYLVWYGQEAKMYALLTALVPLALWLTIEAAERGGWRRWITLYVVTSVCFYTHVLAALVVPLQAIWFLVLRGGWGGSETHQAPGASEAPGAWWAILRAIRPWLAPVIYLFALVLPYLPLVWWQAVLWLSPTFETGHPFVPLPEMATVLVVAFSRGILPVQESLTLLPFVLALLAGALLWPGGDRRQESGGRRQESGDGRDRWRPLVLLLTWLLFPVLAIYGVSLGMPIFADRYLIWIMPAFLALIGMGIVVLARGWRPLALAALAAIMALNLADVAAHANQPIKADFRGAAAFVLPQLQKDDLVIFQIPYSRFTFRYYSGRSVNRVDGPYTNDGMSETELANQMVTAVGQASVAWLVASEAELWDARGLTEKWLAAHGAITDRAEFMRVTVTRYDLR